MFQILCFAFCSTSTTDDNRSSSVHYHVIAMRDLLLLFFIISYYFTFLWCPFHYLLDVIGARYHRVCHVASVFINIGFEEDKLFGIAAYCCGYVFLVLFENMRPHVRRAFGQPYGCLKTTSCHIENVLFAG